MKPDECAMQRCECDKKKFRPGYAFVPFQHMGKLLTPEAALMAGTVFPELNLTIEEYERGLYNGV